MKQQIKFFENDTVVETIDYFVSSDLSPYNSKASFVRKAVRDLINKELKKERALENELQPEKEAPHENVS